MWCTKSTNPCKRAAQLHSFQECIRPANMHILLHICGDNDLTFFFWLRLTVNELSPPFLSSLRGGTYRGEARVVQELHGTTRSECTADLAVNDRSFQY